MTTTHNPTNDSPTNDSPNALTTRDILTAAAMLVLAMAANSLVGSILLPIPFMYLYVSAITVGTKRSMTVSMSWAPAGMGSCRMPAVSLAAGRANSSPSATNIGISRWTRASARGGGTMMPKRTSTCSQTVTRT